MRFSWLGPTKVLGLQVFLYHICSISTFNFVQLEDVKNIWLRLLMLVKYQLIQPKLTISKASFTNNTVTNNTKSRSFNFTECSTISMSSKKRRFFLGLATLLERVGRKKIAEKFYIFKKYIFGVIWAVKLEEMWFIVRSVNVQPIFLRKMVKIIYKARRQLLEKC